MARDDEFRKVAEDVRALARSLARDFREAVDQSRAGGSAPGQAVRNGLRGVAGEARRSAKQSWSGVCPANFFCPPRHHRHRRWNPPAPPPGAPASPSGAPGGGESSGRVPAGPAWARSAERRHRRDPLPPVRRRWDAGTVVGTLAVLFGVAWLLNAVHALHTPVEGVVALGLMLLGASLIVTGRSDWSLSRRSWPVFVGAGMIAVLVATSSTFGAGPSIRDLSFGTRNVVLTEPGRVHGGFGTLNVDAGQLHNGGKVTISSVAGEVRVLVPNDVAVHLDAHVLAGRICFNGKDVGDGVGGSAHEDFVPPGDPPQRLIIDAHEVSGEITVGSPGCLR